MKAAHAEETTAKTLPTAGEEWLEPYLKSEKFTPLGRLVANILNVVYVGIYHVSDEVLFKKSEWYDKNHIALFFDSELATYDYSRMTLLVLLCHKYSVRFRVRAVIQKKEYEGRTYETPMLEFLFSARKPLGERGSVSGEHPNLSQAIQMLESGFGIELRS